MTAGRKSKQVSALKTCDNLESTIQTLKTYQREIEKEKKLTAKTSEFWELAGTKLAGLKIPTRRIVLDSRVVQIGVSNAASFSKHWIILVTTYTGVICERWGPIKKDSLIKDQE